MHHRNKEVEKIIEHKYKLIHVQNCNDHKNRTHSESSTLKALEIIINEDLIPIVKAIFRKQSSKGKKSQKERKHAIIKDKMDTVRDRYQNDKINNNSRHFEPFFGVFVASMV